MSYRKFDEEFKRNAVKLVESGQTSAQVARDLGLHVNQVYEWCKRFRTEPSTHGNAAHNQDEVTQLRKELERTKMELDILKKAVGIFSRPEVPRRP
jgi:transposase